MTLHEFYLADIESYTNTHDRQLARRYWLLAVMETLHERAITMSPVPLRKTKNLSAVRFLGFWRKRSDDDLYDFLNKVRPYWRRPENRGQALE